MPTRLTFVVIGLCLVVFLVQAATAPIAALSPIVKWGRLVFSDYLAFTQPWRWITYQYIHLDGGHVFFNCLALYFFMPTLERLWGWRRTIIFYTIGGIVGGVTYGLVSLLAGSGRYGGLIGASGSILAVLGALAAVVPDMPVILIFVPMTMRTMALVFGILYTLTVVGDRNLSDAAHLGGLVFGYVAPRVGSGFWQSWMRRFQQKRLRRSVNAERDEQEMVDRILAKVHDRGMNSLSWSERRLLKKATEHQRQRDLELARSKKW